MKHRYKKLLVLFSILLATTVYADDGWKVIFNGKDLTGWRTLTGKEGAFAVVNGTLRANAKTKTMDPLFYVGNLKDGFVRFKNFELELCARSELNSNSGIFIHTDMTTRTNRLYLNTGYGNEIPRLCNRLSDTLVDVLSSNTCFVAVENANSGVNLKEAET